MSVGAGADRGEWIPDGRTVLPPEHNVEMRWADVDPEAYLTPNEQFFVRSHSASPRIDASTWRLRIDGDAVARPFDIGYDELLDLSTTTRVCALECAGNGRILFAREHGRVPAGEAWGLGAIGVAEWTGVPLADLLNRAGVLPAAIEVVPHGLDELRVRRPLPIQRAAERDVLVAIAMNGEPLPTDHGFPARLIVPGWAAVASIKWIGRLEVSSSPTHTWWNTEHYVLRGDAYEPEGPGGGRVIWEQVLKSALVLPWPAHLPPGATVLTGRSWSPDSAIARVEVSVDGGPWAPAVLREPNLPGAWVRWTFDWEAPAGGHAIRVRATDARGRTQPDEVPWNERGYLYGAVVSHPVEVAGGTPVTRGSG
jgi:DMSO/TMAO reductase YedYZ molybdopterin-dependent catalytic subunit